MTDQPQETVAERDQTGISGELAPRTMKRETLTEIFVKPPSPKQVLKDAAEFENRAKAGEEKLLTPEESRQYLSELKARLETLGQRFAL
jgi:hypothetical protein